jgi:hypothetical protein
MQIRGMESVQSNKRKLDCEAYKRGNSVGCEQSLSDHHQRIETITRAENFTDRYGTVTTAFDIKRQWLGPQWRLDKSAGDKISMNASHEPIWTTSFSPVQIMFVQAVSRTGQG